MKNFFLYFFSTLSAHNPNYNIKGKNGKGGFLMKLDTFFPLSSLFLSSMIRLKVTHSDRKQNLTLLSRWFPPPHSHTYTRPPLTTIPYHLKKFPFLSKRQKFFPFPIVLLAICRRIEGKKSVSTKWNHQFSNRVKDFLFFSSVTVTQLQWKRDETSRYLHLELH